MKVLVLIKQVPDVASLRLDMGHRLIRKGVALFANPFDLRALALGGRLKAELGAELIAATMGPPQAREVLDLAYAAGDADRCIHVNDQVLAGSDTLVTATVLARLAERVSPDLIVAGRYSVDSETGQVPEQLAALLGWPCLTAIREFTLERIVIDRVHDRSRESALDLEDRADSPGRRIAEGDPTQPGSALAPGGQRVVMRCETDDGMEWSSADLPLVVTVAERLMPPAKATPEQLAAVRDRPIETLKASDLGLRPKAVGTAGSPTWVAGIRPVATSRKPVRVDDPTPAALAEALDTAVIGRIDRITSAGATAATGPTDSDSARSVWVLLEAPGGEISTPSLALLGLAQRLGGQVTGILLGRAGIEAAAPAAFDHGAGRVVVGRNDYLEPFASETWETALDALLETENRPDLVIGSATRIGRGTLSRLAARRGLGLTGDSVGIELTEEGALRHLKPAFGGNVVAPIGCLTTPELATIVPGTVPPGEPRASSGPVDVVDVACRPPRIAIDRTDISAADDVSALDAADLVLCVGNALDDASEIDVIRRMLARLERATGLSGALAATRRVTDAGLLPRQIQIGLTGRAIAPKLYIGLGVRGAAYHMVGVKQAGIVVAINDDPDAPIFADCDLGLVGNWRDLLPAIVEHMESRRGGMDRVAE